MEPINTTVELLKGWASLIGAISWPLVIVFVLLYFGRLCDHRRNFRAAVSVTRWGQGAS